MEAKIIEHSHRARADRFVRNAFVLSSHNLTGRVVSGAGFTFLGISIRTLITIGSMAFLARFLGPADFGYVAMATVVTEFAALLGGFGFTNILIQRKRIYRIQLDTVFWAGIVVGATLTLAVWCMSYATDWLFSDPFAGELLRVMALTFLLGGMTHAHEALLARLMRFNVEFWIQILVIFIRSLVAVLCAFYGFGVWSLVIGALAGGLANVILIVVTIPYWPRFRFHGAYLAETWRTSGSYLGNGFLYYINMNVDVILIGRGLGAGALGYYQNARSLTDEIRGRIAVPLQRVLFPAFSALQGDLGRLQASVLRSGRLLAAFMMPVGIGIAAVAEEVVPTLYGDKWLAMIPILKMFGISAAIRSSTAIASSLYNSQNKVSLGFKYNLVGTLLTIGAVYFSIPYGIEAVATALAVSSMFAMVTFIVGIQLIGMSMRHLSEIFTVPAFASGAMWLAISYARPFIVSAVPVEYLRLLTLIVLGAAMYSILLLVASPGYLRELRSLIKNSPAKFTKN